MFYDALTVAAVCDELRNTILGGRVQKILRLSEHALGCEIYANHRRHWLFLSAHPKDARANLTADRLARGSDDVSPLLLLLRKHCRDGRVIDIRQPPLERMIVLTVSKLMDEPAGVVEQCELIIEAMGRYSNLVLVDGRGMVLDCLKRVPAQVNRYRVVLPQHPYVPPPPQVKTAPDSLSLDLLQQAAASLAPETPLWKSLVDVVAGMSPLLARETVSRAAGEVNLPVSVLWRPGLGLRVLSELRGLYAGLVDHIWQPSIVREEGTIIAFAPYLLTHLGNPEPCATISDAIDTYYGETEQLTASGQQKAALGREVLDARQRHARRKEALERQLALGREAERLRLSGEAILTALAAIMPGQRQLEANGLNVALDPHLSAVDNAQSYFREYKKAKGAVQQVPELVAVEEASIAFYDEVAAHLDLAETVEEVRRVAADLRLPSSGGTDRKPKVQKREAKARATKTGRQADRKGPPPLRVLPGGFEVYVGRSARQNEEVTFQTAGPDDLWLHARGVPGAHVVIKARGREVPEVVIVSAARLAAAFSQARESSYVTVDVTARKYVRRVRAGLPGLVSYSGERTLSVAPEAVARRR